MPTTPNVKLKTNASADVLNAIANSMTTPLAEKLPIVTEGSNETLQKFGSVIMDYPSLQNAFLGELINRIAKVVIRNTLFDNPLRVLKKGFLEFGETVEEVFIDLIDPNYYDLEKAEKEVFKYKFPTVKSAFHLMNYRIFYKMTILQDELKFALTSFSGVESFISGLIDKIYVSANYDEYNATKYLLGRSMLNGLITTKKVPEQTTKDGLESTVIAYRGISNNFQFMKKDYNIARVRNTTPKEKQVLLVDSVYEAEQGVKVLATAFNMDEANYPARRILIDELADVDFARLKECFPEDTGAIIEYTDVEKEALNKIKVAIFDEDFFQIYDNYDYFRENFNGQADGWQYFYHLGKTFSISPFCNAVIFVPTEQSITGVTVTPTKATGIVGSTLQLSVNVSNTGFASKEVTYSVDNDNVSVDVSGNVKLLVAGKSVITVTSVVDPTKTATCTITVLAVE